MAMKASLAMIMSALMLCSSISCYCSPVPADMAGKGNGHAHHHMNMGMEGDTHRVDRGEPPEGNCLQQPCSHAQCDDQAFGFEVDVAKFKPAKQSSPDVALAVDTSVLLLAIPATVHETGPPYNFDDRIPDSPVTRHDISLE